MKENNFIDECIDSLLKARVFGIAAGFDMHFISEIDHLIATAAANRKDESK